MHGVITAQSELGSLLAGKLPHLHVDSNRHEFFAEFLESLKRLSITPPG